MRLALTSRLLFVFVVLPTLFCPSYSRAAADFPQYENIDTNVAFWTKVYTEYDTTHAMVHDSIDLDIVYDVIELEPHDAPSARKINRERMKHARAKYERILRLLAADPDRDGIECRRIAALFGDHGSSRAYKIASRQVRCQIGQSDRFRAGLIRSGAYIDEIKAIFKSHGLPEDLAYLPHVESSFNPKAYSKFGAAGIWQFTRSTGRRFMKVGYVLDERRDPILATHAAAELLKDNYEKLGSWPLAITAYNHGAAGMERAKRSHGDYASIFDSYRSRTFKFASRNFYSEFLAALQVATNFQDYFGDVELDQPAACRTIVLDGYVGFDALCDHLNLSRELARDLNPALRPPVFEGQKLVPKDYPFRLPADILLAQVPSGLYREDQKPSRFYTVQPGDTAGRVARVHGVKLTDLILANNLDRRALIYPKQTLRIPLPGELVTVPDRPEPEPEPIEPILVADNDDTDTPPIVVTPDVDTPAVNAPTHDAATEVTEHYPRPVLASIFPPALDTALEVDEKTEAVKDEQAPNVEIVAADVRFESLNNHSSRPAGIIQVEVEETLGHYAEWAGVRTQLIRRLNALSFGQTLHLHQKIKIPLNRTTAQKFEENRYEFHKRLQEDFFAAYRISDLQTYRVKRGDNLWNLCLEKFDIPMWLLKNCNPEVDFAELRMNQKLMVPQIEKSAAEESDDDLPPEKELDGVGPPIETVTDKPAADHELPVRPVADQATLFKLTAWGAIP